MDRGGKEHAKGRCTEGFMEKTRSENMEEALTREEAW